MEKLTRCIVPVQYYECSRCGFLSSITHQQLSEIQWSKLNHDFHHYNESASREELGFQQPPYAEQAMMIEILIRNEIIDGGDILDYAAGYGTLSHILNKYYDRKIECYDKFIKNSSLSYVE